LPTALDRVDVGDFDLFAQKDGASGEDVEREGAMVEVVVCGGAAGVVEALVWLVVGWVL
jgi:hypothetical protein